MTLDKKRETVFNVACSQTLYFLCKVRRALVIKYKPQGIYQQPAQEGGGGGRFLALRARSHALGARSHALASLADVFEKNEKKNKTTSVYRLV